MVAKAPAAKRQAKADEVKWPARVARWLAASRPVRSLSRLGSGVEAWLRASLRRWLVWPIVVLMVVIALTVGLAGRRIVNVLLPSLFGGQLAVSSEMAANVVAMRGEELAQAGARLAGNQELAAALRSDRRQDALDQVRAAAQLLGVDATFVADADDPALDSLLSGEAGVGQSAQGSGLFLDTNLAATLRRLSSSPAAATTAAAAPSAEMGIAQGGDEPLLYAAAPVLTDNKVEGLLVLGVSLRQILETANTSSASALVFYNTERQPVFSTFPKDGQPRDSFPALPGLGTGHPVSTEMIEATLDGKTYGYTARPLIVKGRTLGYLAVWQSLASIIEGARVLQRLLTIFLVLLLLGIFVAGNWLAARAIQPVLTLVGAARALAEDDSAQYDPERQRPVGELAALSEAFSHLSQQVHRQTDTLRTQAQQYSYLFEASAELGRTLDLDDSMQTAAEALQGLGDLTYVVVLAGRGELGPYTCRAVRGLPPEDVDRILGREFPVPLWGVMARALVGRQPLVIDDIVAQKRPQPDEFAWDVGQGSMLLFPVVGAGGPSALIVIGAQTAGAFSSGPLADLVFALARIAAQSIQNAQLYQEAVRSQEQMVTLQLISRLVVSSATQIESVLDTVVAEAGELMEGSQALLFLKEPSGHGMRLHNRPSGVEAVLAVHSDAVAWVTQAGAPIFYDPDQPLSNSPILVHTGPAMCAPLEVNDETVGALVVISRDRRRLFAEDDMVVLRTLTNAAASAVHTAQLTQRFQGDYLDLAHAWASRADLKVWGSTGHATRVAQNALALAEALGLPPDLLPVLQIASYLHDIALEEPDEDLRHAEGAPHAAIAADWLAAAGLDERVVALVRNHHTAPPGEAGDSDLERAAAILDLANYVDCWLQSCSDCAGAGPTQLFEAIAAEMGDSFSPMLMAELLKLWTEGRLAVP